MSDIQPTISSSLKDSSLAELQAIFQDPSIGRVLISQSDGAEKMEWTIPDLTEILGERARCIT